MSLISSTRIEPDVPGVLTAGLDTGQLIGHTTDSTPLGGPGDSSWILFDNVAGSDINLLDDGVTFSLDGTGGKTYHCVATFQPTVANGTTFFGVGLYNSFGGITDYIGWAPAASIKPAHVSGNFVVQDGTTCSLQVQSFIVAATADESLVTASISIIRVR